MDILIRAVRVINPLSSLHQKVVDVHISKGIIQAIGEKLARPADVDEWYSEGHCLSPGWVDLHTYCFDPGFEQRETLPSAMTAAAAGGFTHICTMPHTLPVTQNKAQIDYQLQKAAGQPVRILPVGALSHQLEGRELAELFELHEAGAIAFSDGLKPSPSAGFMERALLYSKAFNGLVMAHAEDASLAKNGVMHEGVRSTMTGLPGLPEISETLAVAQWLSVLEYTGGRLHFLDLSTQQSIDLVQQAATKGLAVTASVNAYQVAATDEQVDPADARWKVNPPLRNQATASFLLRALTNTSNTLFNFSSQHRPLEEDVKRVEFDKAGFGFAGLETAYALVNSAIDEATDDSWVATAFSLNARKALQIPLPGFKQGEMADMTLFSPTKKWTVSESSLFSKSKNTPFLGRELTGQVLGIINNNHSYYYGR
ncbi:MAG: dihydroorotase [Chitinophagales bacterium]